MSTSDIARIILWINRNIRAEMSFPMETLADYFGETSRWRHWQTTSEKHPDGGIGLNSLHFFVNFSIRIAIKASNFIL